MIYEKSAVNTYSNFVSDNVAYVDRTLYRLPRLPTCQDLTLNSPARYIWYWLPSRINKWCGINDWLRNIYSIHCNIYSHAKRGWQYIYVYIYIYIRSTFQRSVNNITFVLVYIYIYIYIYMYIYNSSVKIFICKLNELKQRTTKSENTK